MFGKKSDIISRKLLLWSKRQPKLQSKVDLTNLWLISSVFIKVLDEKMFGKKSDILVRL